MASIKIKSNIGSVVASVLVDFDKLKNPDYLIRPVCFGLIDTMTKRIHIDGTASDAGPIGNYSKGYLSLRIAKYSRSNDKKTIVSLTRQLENDWAVIATTKGYAIGFNNSYNLKKARWVEEIKGKIIFDLTPSESNYVTNYINELTNEALHGK